MQRSRRASKQELAAEADYLALWLDCDKEAGLSRADLREADTVAAKGENICFEVISLCTSVVIPERCIRRVMRVLVPVEAKTFPRTTSTGHGLLVCPSPEASARLPRAQFSALTEPELRGLAPFCPQTVRERISGC